MEKKGNISIWKIDENHSVFYNLNNKHEIIEKIISLHNKKEQEQKNPQLLELVSNKIKSDNFEILIYKKTRKSVGLYSFLEKYLDATKNYENIDNDIICFLYSQDTIFAIASRSGFHVILPYSDDAFPFFIAKKIFSGKFSQQEARKITGITYSEMAQYRGGRGFSRRESFGKIWKKLIGEIRSDIKNDFPELGKNIEIEKGGNAEIKSSIIFKKALTFETLQKIIIDLEKISKTKLTTEEEKKFAFLDTVRLIDSKNEVEKLKEHFISYLFNIISNEKWDEADNIDFCHPEKSFIFFYGEDFSFQGQSPSWLSDFPKTKEVLKEIKNQNILDCTNLINFSRDIEIKDFLFKNRETGQNISEPLIKYFHGEIIKDNKTYFLIDSKWYDVHENFLENLTNDFIDEVFNSNDGIYKNLIPFIEWEKIGSKYLEDNFNKEQSKKEKFYYGDKIFATSEKGGIELFDLLYNTDNELFIIQVKNGFGGSVRDACSQIRMSAETIEHDIKHGRKELLKKFYIDWKKNPINDLSEDAFLELFKKDRKYILACSVDNFSDNIFRNKKLYSQIAKFETLELNHYFLGNGWHFHIQNIFKK